LKPDLSYGYYQRACLYEKDQDMVYANEDFKVVREIDPLNQHAIFNHAIYNFQRQLWEDAIEAFSNLISLSPVNGLSYLFRGRANAAISRWDEALEDLSRSIQLCPDNSQAFFHRGCLLKDRNIDQAIQDFSVSLLLDDSPLNSDAFYHRAQLYSARHEKLHAFNDYKVVVEQNPKKSSAYLELGILSMAVSKDHQQSLLYLDEAIRMDPRQLQGYLSRGELYHILYNNSINQIKVLKEQKKSDSNKKDISELYAKKSIQDYSRAIHAIPGNYLLYLYRGRLLLKIGRMKDATSDFYTAFKLNAGIAQTFIQRALILTFQGKYDQIVSEFDTRAKYENLSDPAVYLLIAKARVQCNDNLGALKDLDNSLKIRYKDPVVHLQRGICFENLLEFNNAIDEFTEAIEIDPHFAKAYYHRGMCSMKFRRDGVDDLNKVIYVAKAK
jgi:tetratricopeptide (TPR) repeat protein